MDIGYACIAVGVDGSMGSCNLRNASLERLTRLTEQNLDSLERLIDYNIRSGIHLFRISSDLVPFGANPVNTLDWTKIFQERLEKIGEKALSAGMRLSVHPGQYTVLNSPKDEVVRAAMADLEYHNKILDGLGLDSSHKIILHIGGGYGDHRAAMERFVHNVKELKPGLRDRLVIENDQRTFQIAEVMDISQRTGLPVVFDLLHYLIHPDAKRESWEFWVKEAAKTWRTQDGNPKVHYSQQAPGRTPGAHSTTIGLEKFMDFAEKLSSTNTDIMLEVKDKNLSAVKCLNAMAQDKKINRLEAEWGRYKYNVLEHSPNHYKKIRALLNGKNSYPVLDFYNLLDEAMAMDVTSGNAINGGQHVWGYFKDQANQKEKIRFSTITDGIEAGNATIQMMKSFLFKLSKKYQNDYLNQSLYFYLS